MTQNPFLSEPSQDRPAALPPLASGLLTGKYRRGEPAPAGTRLAAWNAESLQSDHTFDVVENLESFAAERSITLLDSHRRPRGPTIDVVRERRSDVTGTVAANVKAGRWIPTTDDLVELLIAGP